jgi:hypothetical protein
MSLINPLSSGSTGMMPIMMMPVMMVPVPVSGGTTADAGFQNAMLSMQSTLSPYLQNALAPTFQSAIASSQTAPSPYLQSAYLPTSPYSANPLATQAYNPYAPQAYNPYDLQNSAQTTTQAPDISSAMLGMLQTMLTMMLSLFSASGLMPTPSAASTDNSTASTTTATTPDSTTAAATTDSTTTPGDLYGTSPTSASLIPASSYSYSA